MDSAIKFSDFKLKMENNTLHSTNIEITPKSERNSTTLKNVNGDSNIYIKENCPITPLTTSKPHYDRNSRLGNHPFRRI